MTAIEKVGTVAIDYDAVLKTLGLNPRDPDVQALLLICNRYELDPVLKHMLLIKGQTYVTHKGLWHIGHRSNLLDGHEIVEEGETDKEWWAKVAIYRKDWSRPVTMKGRYPKAGTNKQYGQEMAVTRAECLVLRRLFDVAVPVYEEINWPEDRGAGRSVGEVVAPPPTAQNGGGARPTPPPGVDADTGEIVAPKPRTFPAPRKTIRQLDEEAKSLVGKAKAVKAVDRLVALKARIAALSEQDRETLGEAWKAAGLPSVAGSGAKLTDDQYTAADGLVTAQEKADAATA